MSNEERAAKYKLAHRLLDEAIELLDAAYADHCATVRAEGGYRD